jgi:hypothetical protein
LSPSIATDLPSSTLNVCPFNSIIGTEKKINERRCIEYSTSNGEETVRSQKAHLIVEKGMHKLYIYKAPLI